MTSPLLELIELGKLHNVRALPDEIDQHAINATQELVTRLERHIADIPPPDDDQWYPWISLSLGTYFENMRICRNYQGPGRHHYLELGSGIGTKLILAHALGYHAQGIEHHLPYIAISRHLAPHCLATWHDATQPHTLYQHADLIYNYGLAKDPDQHARINQQITQWMRPGALYFTPRHPQPDHLQHIAGNVWTKP